MADFNFAYHRVAKAEGGYQKHPNDSGNYNSSDELVGTNWGINAKIYESYLGYKPSEGDMRDMEKTTAMKIYKARYWDRVKGDQITSQPVADIIFDSGVNHGTSRATKMLQEVLGITIDGKFGQQTLNTVNSTAPNILYNYYKEKRIEFYQYLVRRTPKYGVFLKGWLNRMAKFQDFSPLKKKILDRAISYGYRTSIYFFNLLKIFYHV